MKRDNLYTKTGEPKRIKCYMAKRNPTTDYITVVYTNAFRLGYPVGTVLYRGMNDIPTHPQGFGQWGEAYQHNFRAGGSRVAFSDLPEECQKVIRWDYEELWGVIKQKNKISRGMRMAYNSVSNGINGELRIGDIVVSTGIVGYSYLVGTIIDINKVGSPEHEEETSNETDSIHVDFYREDYSEQRVCEIGTEFSELYGEKKTFDTCALDDVTMPPESLIKINDFSQEDLNLLLEGKESATAVCNRILAKI